MDNDDLEDFMDNYNKTALIKTSNKNKKLFKRRKHPMKMLHYKYYYGTVNISEEDNV